MEEKLTARINQAIAEKIFPGAVVGIVKTNRERVVYPHGHFTYEADSSLVKEDTIYDMASVTKSIPGSCSLLQLIDEGKLSIEDRLVDYIPEFGNFENKKEVRIKHILTYTLDLEIQSMSVLKDKQPEEIMDLVMKAPLVSAPGEKFVYTNSTALFINPLIEKITGKSIDTYAQEHFFTPLNMNRTTFFPETFSKEEIAPTEIDQWRGRTIQGEVHDESTFVLRKKYMSAAAGLFSAAPDILNFLEMLLNKGMKDGKRYFSENIVKEMHTNHIDNGKDKAGLGWVLNWPEATGTTCSPETFCKSGFTGTFVAVDPVKGIAFTLLSNRTYPHRAPDMSAITKVRGDIGNIIFA